jgi:hypothetical protein
MRKMETIPGLGWRPDAHCILLFWSLASAHTPLIGNPFARAPHNPRSRGIVLENLHGF